MVSGGTIGLVAFTIAAIGVAPNTVANWMFVITPSLFFGCTGYVIVAAPLDADAHVVRRRLASNLCGACAYPIDAAQPEPDGCRVCPECGGAWRAMPRQS